MEKKIDELITEYENIWNSGRFDLAIEKVTQDLHKLKAELKEQHEKKLKALREKHKENISDCYDNALNSFIIFSEQQKRD